MRAGSNKKTATVCYAILAAASKVAGKQPEGRLPEKESYKRNLPARGGY
jgi:hypothetical protein